MARRVALFVLLAALAGAPAALADGDPASDYLLGQATFVPPDDGVPSSYTSKLEATVREAKARGYEIRVALIGTRYDLGAVGVLWRKPKQYARFLGQELRFVYKGRLLVVMPNGLGVSRGGAAQPHEQAVVDRLGAPGANGRALAAAAARAVVQLAAARGVVVPAPALSARGGSSSNRDRVTIAAAALAASLVAAGAVLYRRRRTPPAV